MIPNCADAFRPLRGTINEKFLLMVLGGSVSDLEKALFSLPARRGGMGIRDPVELAQSAYSEGWDCKGYQGSSLCRNTG